MSFSRVLYGWSLAVLLALASTHVFAEEVAPNAKTPAAKPTAASPSKTVVSSDPAWHVMIDVKRFIGNPFGKDVFDLVQKLIAEENGVKDMSALRAKAAKVIGFDPLDGIERITIYGLTNPLEGDITHFNENQFAEKTAAGSVFVVQLTNSSGNLAGFVLAMPDYQSTEYQKTTIHSSMIPQFKSRIYVAIRESEEGKPSFVVVGLREDLVKEAVDRLLAPGRLEQPIAPLGGAVAGEAPHAFFTASLKTDDKEIRSFLKIPTPNSAVLKMLQRLTVSLGAEDKSIVARVSAETVDEKRAEQIRQLVQGAIAFMQMPITELEEQKDFAKIRKLLGDMTVSRSGNHVTLQLSRPAAGLLDEIRHLDGD